MNNTAIQMELLSEVRTPAQALNYALERERSQQNRKEILRGNNSKSKTTQHVKQNQPYYQHQTQNSTHNVGDVKDPSHLITTIIAQQKHHNVTYVKHQDTWQKCADHKYHHFPKTENINEEDNQTIEPPLDEEDDELETIDPEPTMYIKELMEDWNKINLIERDFKDVRNSELNNTTPHGETIKQTTLKNKKKLNCLVDTGSPRSFIDI